MKYLIPITLFLISFSAFAQKPCDYSVNVKDSLGTYKNTKDYLISEKNFGGKSSYIFFTLALTDGLPTLNMQIIEKSKEFIKARCFDKNSKLFLQLDNGKIITLIHLDQENCGTSVRDQNGFDNRITSCIFMFMKESFAELKKSPVSMMRVKSLTDMEDFVVRKELKSELNNQTYFPETYFMDALHCVE